MLGRLAAWVGVFALAAAASARATPITYTETATASGTLDGTSFTDATVTITLSTDTSTVVPDLASLGFDNTGVSTTVTVSGIGGSDTFADVFEAFAFPLGGGAGAAGITDVSGSNLVLLSTNNAAFATYNLKTAIGPLTGDESGFNPGLAFATTGGQLTLNSLTPFASTFTATVPAPEPATFTLTTLGLAGVVTRHRRRRVRSVS